MKPLRSFAVLIAAQICCGIAALPCRADENSDRSLEIFEKQIRPVLLEHCIRCHGPDKQQGGLRLDSREGWSTGGDSGAAIVPGNRESLLLRAIRYEDIELEMPPRGKLPEKTIDAFDKWVNGGAVDPRVASDSPATPTDGNENDSLVSPTVEEGKFFWSFQPVTPPPIPKRGDGWSRTDIDRFIYATLEEAGITPAKDADPAVLLRRLYYDLIGLPPTPDEINDFLSDPSPAAYQAAVDRLLDSRHFGERWGRHWLDVVRFAESSGGGRTLLFPEAWRYRDYVIDSFHRDVPYDRFLIEQIAGDLLPFEDWQQRSRNLTATAFLLLGPINYEMQDKDILEMDIVDEQLDTIGKAMMGMTIGCARCHDHKFDPIPADDYYAMAGILKSTHSVTHSNVSKWNTVQLPLAADQEREFEAYQVRLAKLQKSHRNAIEQWIEAGGKPKGSSDLQSIDPVRIRGIVVDDSDAELTGQWVESTSITGYVGDHYIHDATESKGSKAVVYRPKLTTAGTYEVLASYSASSNRSSHVPFHVHHADGVDVVRVNQKQKPSVASCFQSLGTFDFDPAANPQVIISNEGTEDGVVIADAIVWIEADRESPGLLRGEGLPDVPHDPQLTASRKKVVDDLAAQIKKVQASAPSRPVAMATADATQVGDIHLAIRGQAHLKGHLVRRGVIQVASWDSFPEIPDGQSGRNELAQWIADPHHPLTARVMANRVWYWLTGRGIVPTVDNFGRTGQLPTHPPLLDHLAVTLVGEGWSMKQLIREIVSSRVYQLASDSDELRQSLDPENRLYWRMNRKRLRAEDIRDSLLVVSGDLDDRYGGSNIAPGTTIEYGYSFDSKRRSVYMPVFRNTLPEVFEVFDFADPNTQRGRRTSSTVASQALWMMNHPMVIQQSQQAAARLMDLPLDDNDARIHYSTLQVLGRPPTDAEQAIAVDLLGGEGQNESSVARWAVWYRVLFQSLDFRFLD